MVLIFTSCSNSPKFDKYIGLDIKSKEMQQFLKDLGEPQISKYEAQPGVPAKTIGEITIQAMKSSPASTYYNYKEKGIHISLNDRDIVDAIFLFGEGKDGYRQYQKELPFNLKFTDTRKNINEKFGKPDATYGGSSEYNIQCFDSWSKSKGITVTYNTTDSTNTLATLSQICIQTSDENN